MRDLETIFCLQESGSPSFHLDVAEEAILDGNFGTAYIHTLDLMHEEMSQLQNESLPRTYLRFSGLSSDKGYEEIKEDIKSGRITLSNPFKYNDPMDPLLKVWIGLQRKKAWNKREKQFFGTTMKALKNLRVCCMADSSLTDKFHPLMWSHYADSHKGIAIRYKITQETIDRYNDEDHLLKLCPVAYNKLIRMSEQINIDEALLTKDTCWQYEAEHRLIYFTTRNQELKIGNNDGEIVSKDYISLLGFEIEAVYLGAKMDNKKKSEISRIALSRGISVYEMKYSTEDITRLQAQKKTK